MFYHNFYFSLTHPDLHPDPNLHCHSHPDSDLQPYAHPRPESDHHLYYDLHPDPVPDPHYHPHFVQILILSLNLIIITKVCLKSPR